MEGCGYRGPGEGLSGKGDYRTCLKESFDGYDTDKDGFITFEEVAAAWRRCLVDSHQEVDEERVRNEALVREFVGGDLVLGWGGRQKIFNFRGTGSKKCALLD